MIDEEKGDHHDLSYIGIHQRQFAWLYNSVDVDNITSTNW